MAASMLECVDMLSTLLLALLASLSIAADAQEDCQRPPLWMFFRQDDVKLVFPTLPGGCLWMLMLVHINLMANYIISMISCGWSWVGYIYVVHCCFCSDEFIIFVRNGVVDGIAATADPVMAELVYFTTSVAEFPITWCIRSNIFEVSVYMQLSL